MSKLGDRMVLYRAKERISQGELAKRCGLTAVTVCNIENDVQEPSKVTRAKIELVIGKEEEE
jgi:transcriptional regulator with XRE-family HTH domain